MTLLRGINLVAVMMEQYYKIPRQRDLVALLLAEDRSVRMCTYSFDPHLSNSYTVIQIFVGTVGD